MSKAAIAAKQAELIRVLGTPLVLTGFMGKYPTKSGQLELPTDLHGKDPTSRAVTELVSCSNLSAMP